MILAIEESKVLRTVGTRIGRAGMSQRVHQLVSEYISANPDGHYKEAIKLAGRLHAIFIASKCDGYWREKANEGYRKELYEIGSFVPKIEEPKESE